MYVLTGSGAFYISRGVDHSVGRKSDCAIALLAETKHAISRKHGLLSCRNNGELSYTDQSTFGTFINEKKIVKETVPIKPGDTLKFGVHPTEWVVTPVQVVPSSLSSSVRSNIVNICNVLDVSYSANWTESSTTLVMTKIAVTMKVLNAVAERRSIVTPEFLTACLTAHKESKPPPLASSYTPPISEQSLAKINFQSHEKRKTLFSPLVFVFLSQTEKTLLESVVKSCGGSAILLDPLQSDRRDLILSELSVVVDTENEGMSSMAKKVLKQRNLVPVKQAEITLAVLHMDKHRLFKSDSSTNYSQLMVESQAYTQAFSSQVILNTVHSEVAKSKDISFLEPSHAPPKLDKTSKSFLQSPTSEMPKETSFLEQSNIPLRRDDDSVPSPANTSKSFLEPSNVPIRLDKTNTFQTPNSKYPLKTPTTASVKPNETSVLEQSNISLQRDKDSLPSPSNTSKSFLEPSNVPIRLDKTNTFQTPHSKDPSKTPTTPKATLLFSRATPTIDQTNKLSPADTSHLKSSDIHSKFDSPNTTKPPPGHRSYIEPSNIPARLDNTTRSTGISPCRTLKPLTEPFTNSTRSFIEPTAKTIHPVIESPHISRSLVETPNISRFEHPDLNTSDVSLFSGEKRHTPSTGTPSRDTIKTYAATPKRTLTTDSSSDDDSNPFQRPDPSSKRSKLAPNISQASVRSEVIIKDDTSENTRAYNITPDPFVEVSPTKENIDISSSLTSISVPSVSEDDRQPIAEPSNSIQTIVKRELTEAVSSDPKRFKSGEIIRDIKPVQGVIQITKVGEDSLEWISHTSSVTDHAFSDLTITDFSVTIVSRDSTITNNKNSYSQNMGTNFKRFRRKDPLVRSLTVTISEAVGEEEVAGWFSSQAQASQAVFDEQDARAHQHSLLENDNPFSRSNASTNRRNRS